MKTIDIVKTLVICIIFVAACRYIFTGEDRYCSGLLNKLEAMTVHPTTSRLETERKYFKYCATVQYYRP